jgi:hypothetical protein
VADRLNTLAEIALDEGRAAEARELATEAIDLARTSTQLTTRDALMTLGRIDLAGGDLGAASPVLAEALELCLEFDQPFELAQCLRAVAAVAGLAGEATAAARLAGAAEQVQGADRESVFPVEADLGALIDRARDELGREAFDAACDEGRRLGRDQVAALAAEVLSARVSAPATARSTRS